MQRLLSNRFYSRKLKQTPVALGKALMIVLDVTDTDLAGSGFTLRATPTHTNAPPDAPSNLRLKMTGQSGEL